MACCMYRLDISSTTEHAPVGCRVACATTAVVTDSIDGSLRGLWQMVSLSLSLSLEGQRLWRELKRRLGKTRYVGMPAVYQPTAME